MRAFLKVAIGRNLFDKSFFQMMVQQLNRIFSVKYMHKMTRSSISIIFRWCSDYDGMNVITLTLLLNGKPTSNHPYGSENQKKKVYQIILNFLLQQSAFLLDEAGEKNQGNYWNFNHLFITLYPVNAGAVFLLQNVLVSLENILYVSLKL